MTTTENKPLAAQSFAEITVETPASAETVETPPTEEPKKGNIVSDLLDKLRGRRPAESTTQSVVPPPSQPAMPVAQPKSALEKIAEMKSNLSKPDGEIDAVEMLSLMEDLYKENAQLKELGVSAKQTADVTNQTIIGSNANYAAEILSKQFGVEITQADLFQAIMPLAEWMEQEYGASAVSPQSMVETFLMVANRDAAKNSVVQSQQKQQRIAPPLPNGSAGSAPATKSLKDAMNEAFAKAANTP